MATLLPPIKWAQRKDRIFLTVELRDIKNEKIEWVNPSHLKIEVTSDGKTYATELIFFNEINIEESKWNITGFHLQFNLVKKESGPHWVRLLKDDKKYNHISVDWSKYVDEDEEDEEADKGLGSDWNPDMMRGFGGDDDDSDDDDDGHDHGHDHVHDENCQHDHDHGNKLDDLDKEEDITEKKEEAKQE